MEEGGDHLRQDGGVGVDQLPSIRLSRSVSEHQQHTTTDQNQNEDSSYLKENTSPHPTPKHAPPPPSSFTTTSKLTKSRSWFNSLSRRPSSARKTPIKKRSFGAIFDNSLSHGKPRLNKSDWDIRKSSVLKTPSDVGRSPSIDRPIPPPSTTGVYSPRTSKSTDCLDDLDSATSDFSTIALTEFDEDSVASRTDLDSLLLDINNATNNAVDNSVGGGGGGSPHPNLYYTIDSRRLASKHKKSQRDRKLLDGVKQFNLDPKAGLEYLVNAGFVQHTPKDVAMFLFRQERLSKKQIGSYLGSHQEFNKQVLHQFVQCHEFSKLLLVQALRQFLWSFRLPGEAMQIDRVMDAFSSHYCEQNPNIFEEPDTCFILSFSIIMLNTALHNPNAKMKITGEQFIRQNKGINNSKDLDPDMLDAIYRNIKEEPFKIPDENYDDLMYTFFSPEREGWLLKQGGSWKTWKRRWFVLNDKCLYYFQHTAENVPKGIIPLENVRVRACEDKDGKQFCFEIYSDMSDIIKGCKTDSSGTVVQGNHKHYRMSATSEEDREVWIQCIQESIREHPFYKIISDKKAAIRRRSGPRTPAKTS